MLGKDKLRTIAKKGVLSAAGWTEGGRLTLKVKLPAKVAKKLRLPTGHRQAGDDHDQGRHREAAAEDLQEGRERLLGSNK